MRAAVRRESQEEVAAVAVLRWGKAKAKTRVFVFEFVLLSQQLNGCLDRGLRFSGWEIGMWVIM